MTLASTAATAPTIRLHDVHLTYRRIHALGGVTLDFPAGKLTGLIGPDGVGKSSLLSLIAGARKIQQGTIEVLGGDMANSAHRKAACRRIAYMPQGLGRNLYPRLSVFENLDFFGRLFVSERADREARIGELLQATDLAPFADRAVAELSGGMKQKLGLCCALIHEPDLLILDEPTTGIDPLSRRQFWRLVAGIRSHRPGMTVLVATAYMEEASRFDHLVAMDAGRVLMSGPPAALLERTGRATLDAAFIALLPEEKRAGHVRVTAPEHGAEMEADIVIAAEKLTKRFDDFTAVDHASFQIHRGEIFGFVGSNGCGKTTTMKMLTGLLTPSDGTALLLGRPTRSHDIETRKHIGYMSQGFSLYSELTVQQNLELHAHLFGVPREEIPARVARMIERFNFAPIADTLPKALPLGIRQRLSLAVAMIHQPDVLILDEPTSGVDPVARDRFWQMLYELSRRDGVTIFISTHFMSEAELCDRVALMHAGRVLVTDTPARIAAGCGAPNLEEAFITHLERAAVATAATSSYRRAAHTGAGRTAGFLHRGGRMLAYTQRETLELLRDPIRASLAVIGSLILMLVIGYGINMDVNNLNFAVLDRDQTPASRDYAAQISGSRYFTQKPPLASYAELDQRMRSGELSIALEIPEGFGRDLARGKATTVGAWFDGSMPARAETVRGYMQGLHVNWLARQAREGSAGTVREPFEMNTIFRYNPELRSLIAMVPAVIPMLLLMIPAMLAALSVVREKELGSIINFYVTPVTRLEFLLGKQIPYVALAMLNWLLVTLFATLVFGVPFTGSLTAFALASFLYVIIATSMGLLISAFMSSQVAAIFGTTLLTMIPAIQFSGMINPVSSLEGAGAVIGRIYPATYYVIIARGTFSKALGFGDIGDSFAPMLLAIPVLLFLSVWALRKQES